MDMEAITDVPGGTRVIGVRPHRHSQWRASGKVGRPHASAHACTSPSRDATSYVHLSTVEWQGGAVGHTAAGALWPQHARAVGGGRCLSSSSLTT